MRRLLTIVFTLFVLTACGSPSVTYSDLVGAAFGPVVTDPATDRARYLLPGKVPTGYSVPLPADAEVIGTQGYGERAIRVYARTGQTPAEVLAFYRATHSDLLEVYSGEGLWVNFCGRGARIYVDVQEEGVVGYGYHAYEGPCERVQDEPPPAATTRPYDDLIPRVGEGEATLSSSDEHASYMAPLVLGERSIEEVAQGYHIRLEAEGWQFVEENLTPSSAWVVWQQQVEGEDLRMQMTLTRQTDETGIISFLVMPSR